MRSEYVEAEVRRGEAAHTFLRSGEEDRAGLPLKGYATLAALYGISMASLLGWANKRGKLVKTVSVPDLVVLGLGSQKLARLMTQNRITTFARQPFTTYGGGSGSLPAEVNETARRDGGALRQALGEMMTCPYCASTWTTGSLFGLYLANRRLGRSLGVFLTAATLTDLAQRFYRRAMA